MIEKLPILDARVIQWNFDELINRSCPICESLDCEACFIRPDDLIVYNCNSCKSYYINPVPSESQLTNFYSSYDEKHRRSLLLSLQETLNDYRVLNPHKDFRIRKLSSFMDFSAAKVLDVGFGRAEFLYLLKKLGASTHGVELDRRSIEIAEAVGIENAFFGTIYDLDDKVKYDLIVMIDVVEYVLEPKNLIHRAVDLLNHDGLLLVMTPNGNFAKHEKLPTTFRVDLEHLQYFTPDTFQYLASELNLRILHLESLGVPQLDGIEHVLIKKDGFKRKVKRLIKLMPVYKYLSILKRLLSNLKSNKNKVGNYSLFCILQKTK